MKPPLRASRAPHLGIQASACVPKYAAPRLQANMGHPAGSRCHECECGLSALLSSEPASPCGFSLPLVRMRLFRRCVPKYAAPCLQANMGTRPAECEFGLSASPSNESASLSCGRECDYSNSPSKGAGDCPLPLFIFGAKATYNLRPFALVA